MLFSSVRGSPCALTAPQEGRVEITEEWNDEWDKQMQVDRKEDGSRKRECERE